jgi:hypothetical protein
MKTHSTVLMMMLAAVGADAASISGVILPPGRAKGVQAFEREGAKLFTILNRYHKGTLDPKTGAFEIPGLPDGTYQLLLDCGDAKVEGVDLHIDDEEDGPVFDYVFKTKKLTVQRLDMSEHFDPDEVVAPARRDRIAGKLMGVPKLIEKLDSLKKVDRFCEHVRPLIAHGTKEKAFVLVEKARLRDFHSGKGQAIYRVEVWPLEKAGAVWEKPNKGVRVLQRHRFTRKADYDMFAAFFDPGLGGLKVLKGKSVTGIRTTIPKQWDDVLGKTRTQAGK